MDDHHFSSITKLKNQRKKMLRVQTQKKQLIQDFILFQNCDVDALVILPKRTESKVNFFRNYCLNLAN
jgi:hypothetical protein